MSLKRRLPLTYAAIALLAALALGAVLLLLLRGFYVRQERQYLRQNAEVIGDLYGSVATEPVEEDEQIESLIQAQVTTLAFLTQTRIRIFDEQDNLLLDSVDGTTEGAAPVVSIQVESDGVRQEFEQWLDGNLEEIGYTSTLEVDREGNSLHVTTEINGVGSIVQLGGLATPWNFGIATMSERRSAQEVRMALRMPFAKGYLVLSDGPAFGRAVVRSVAAGLVVAGASAVATAAWAGVMISRTITVPLTELTETTARVAAGDFGVRSELDRGDEIGRLSTSFNTMADRIETTITSLQRFVADAAHEIHTPITALQTNLELAQSDADRQGYIERAQEQTVRLEQLTHSLLQLSRLDAGGDSATSSSSGRTETTTINLSTLVAERSELFAARAEQTSIHFSIDCAKGVQIIGSAEQLRRVFDNLLDNALKFTLSGGTVTVRLTKQIGMAELTVSDTGIGIDGDPQRVFERFHRAPNAASFSGNGLGLAIVQGIVEQHGGAVAVESSKSGSTFRVSLPTALQLPDEI